MQYSTPAQSKQYFASYEDPNKTAAVLLDKSKSFYNLMEANHYLEKLSRMWRAYHGDYAGDAGYGHSVGYTGEEGELVSFPVNHFRNLAQHIYVMITANRPVMEARAINTDYKSYAQTYLANGILDYYMREKGLEASIKAACEMSIVLGAGFIKMEWNATTGDEYDIDDETGEVIKEGEVEFSNLSPYDVVVDGTKESWNHEWMLVRSFKNRFDLIAKYPEHESAIRAIPPKNVSSVYRLSNFSNDDTDDVAVFEFYHKRTDAMPEGRYMLFVDSGTNLIDTKLPYRGIPIYRIAPSDIMGTPYGYSPMFDVFPIQECINALYSTIMTNQNAFGVQSLFVPKNADIAISQLSEGMNIIEGNVKPEPLQLAQTPAEVFKFLEVLIQSAETISGVNSVARGNPEASLKSGAALALVQSQALQFMSGLQQSYIKLIEDCGTGVINILKDYAMTPKVIALVGKHNRPLLKEFTGDKISAINRVVVDMGNALARSTAGRVQMAEQLLQMNLIKNPQQYLQVLNTGRLDAMFEGDTSDLLLIKSENEQLLEGEAVQAALIDSHKQHIIEHKGVIADPDLRKNPELVKNVLNHIQQHIDYLRNTDPELLGMLGEQPLQGQQQQQGAPQGQPGAPQGGPQGTPPQQSQQNSQNAEMMAQPNGIIANPDQMQGPGVESQRLPNIPQVDASMLANPELQASAMGNVRQR